MRWSTVRPVPGSTMRCRPRQSAMAPRSMGRRRTRSRSVGSPRRRAPVRGWGVPRGAATMRGRTGRARCRPDRSRTPPPRGRGRRRAAHPKTCRVVRAPGERRPSGLAGSPHRGKPVQGLDGADEQRRWTGLRLRHDVQAVVHAVDKVHVGDPGRAEHDGVACGGAHAGVRCAVLDADVGLDLHDPADPGLLDVAAGSGVTDEACAEQCSRSLERRTGEDLARERDRRAAGRRDAGGRLAADGHSVPYSASIESGMRNDVIPMNAGMTCSWSSAPKADPLIAVHRSRRIGSSSGSLGMFVYR